MSIRKLTKTEITDLSVDNEDLRYSGNLDFLWLEITPRCNLSCIHCYAESGPYNPLHGKLNSQDWINVLTEASALGCKSVQFIGGEPTLHPDLGKLIKHARTQGFATIEVFTNGVSINNQLKEIFVQNNVCLAFSIYSSSPTVHDEVTQMNGSFQKTCDSIRWALEAKLSVRASIIEMPTNCGHLDQTVELLNKMGIHSIGVDHIRGIGRGTSGTNSDTAIENKLEQLCGRCWQGKLCVTSSGAVFPCVFSRFISVGSFRDGLRNILRAPALQDFRHSVRQMQSNLINHRVYNCAPNPGCTPDLPECTPDMKCGPDNPCVPEMSCQPDYWPPCEPSTA